MFQQLDVNKDGKVSKSKLWTLEANETVELLYDQIFASVHEDHNGQLEHNVFQALFSGDTR